MHWFWSYDENDVANGMQIDPMILIVKIALLINSVSSISKKVITTKKLPWTQANASLLL